MHRHHLSVFHRRLPSAVLQLYGNHILCQLRLQGRFIAFKLCGIVIAPDAEVHHGSGFIHLKGNRCLMVCQRSFLLGGSCRRRDLRCRPVNHHALGADIVAQVPRRVLRTGVDNIVLFCAQHAGNRHLSAVCRLSFRKFSVIHQCVQFSLCLCRRKSGRIARINIIEILCDTAGLVYAVLRVIRLEYQIDRSIIIEPSEGNRIQQRLPPVLFDGNTEVAAVSCRCLPCGRGLIDMQRHLDGTADIALLDIPYIERLRDLALFREHIARTCAVHRIVKRSISPYVAAQSIGQFFIQSTCIQHLTGICAAVRYTE